MWGLLDRNGVSDGSSLNQLWSMVSQVKKLLATGEIKINNSIIRIPACGKEQKAGAKEHLVLTNGVRTDSPQDTSGLPERNTARGAILNSDTNPCKVHMSGNGSSTS